MDGRLLRTSLGDDLRFARVPLAFEPGTHTNLFALKNNKTIAQTLLHPRYSGLSSVIPLRYQTELQTPPGNFLGGMKAEGDRTYRHFLNRHGDLQYCFSQMLTRSTSVLLAPARTSLATN
ncbi:hypothetical protein ACVW0W_002884 [Bradyrhizobium sp. USDA 4469]